MFKRKLSVSIAMALTAILVTSMTVFARPIGDQSPVSDTPFTQVQCTIVLDDPSSIASQIGLPVRYLNYQLLEDLSGCKLVATASDLGNSSQP